MGAAAEYRDLPHEARLGPPVRAAGASRPVRREQPSGQAEPVRGVSQRGSRTARQFAERYGPCQPGWQLGDRAGCQRGGNGGRGSSRQHRAGNLARRRRPVVSPFTGEHQVSFGQRGVQAGDPAQLGGPGHDLGAPGGGGRSALRSADARLARAPPPGGSRMPAVSVNRAPSAVRAPVPPSVDAEPPRAMRILAAPASSAALISWPVPVVCAPSGSGLASSGSPLARASSMTPVWPGSSSQLLVTRSEPGPLTEAACQLAPGTAAASTSSVPSPPSASGRQLTWSLARTARQPRARAAAAAAAPMLPLNESGATTTRTWSAARLAAAARLPGSARLAVCLTARSRSRQRQLSRRESQLDPDRLLHGLPAGARVDRDDVFLAAEDIEHRIGLLVIVTEPDREGFLGVVFPGDELAAADITLAGHPWAAGEQVVVHAAARAKPPGEDPSADLAVGHVEVDDAVDVVALQEELGLPLVAREAVDDEPEVPVVLGELGLHDPFHQVVADQLAGRHDPPDLRAELGVMLHVPAEDVADTDVLQVEILAEHRGLGTLAAALHPHDDVFAHE